MIIAVYSSMPLITKSSVLDAATYVRIEYSAWFTPSTQIATTKITTLSPRITSPTRRMLERLLMSRAAISVPSRTALPRIASPIPAPRKNPPKTAVSTRSAVTSGKWTVASTSDSPAIASVLRIANARPTWRYPIAMNGTLMTGSSTASGSPVVCASSIEMPVTPPSMRLLESRNP